MSTINAVIDNFVKQAEHCSKLGSPLYASLLPELVKCLDASPLIYATLSNWTADPHDDAVALRFVAALNFLVITRQARTLEPIFGSAIYSASDARKSAICACLIEHQEFIVSYLKLAPQTNEVGRCAVLLGGFLEVVKRFGSDMSVFEIGASAGLNLFFDRYHYQFNGWSWGNKHAMVKCELDWQGERPSLGTINVMSRHACDQSPVDLTRESDRLLSYIWPDQRARVSRLKAAIEQARKSTVTIDVMSASEWLQVQAAKVLPTHPRVFYHSIVWQYLSRLERADFITKLDRLAAAASPQSPLVWLRLEPGADKPWAELRMKIWPDGKDCLLAHSGFHGEWVKWYGTELPQ